MVKLIKMMYAKMFGYFWTPCPICGEHFGGFEIGNGSVIENGKNVCCCRNCDFIAGQIDGITNRHPLVNAKASKFLTRQQFRPDDKHIQYSKPIMSSAVELMIGGSWCRIEGIDFRHAENVKVKLDTVGIKSRILLKKVIYSVDE